ncbi:hypothetical protein BN1232_03922 [Mycobacterium lentiflavum]|uniref:Uncharacterized protein n=1 Tax=Mycobacterium lentiflavum TaxID=141349 RepID=A0A0E4GZ27_MYCLN|nr:hypothetical protein BN1232_03922 [Mycobacterium lentiflavum]
MTAPDALQAVVTVMQTRISNGQRDGSVAADRATLARLPR